MVTVITPSYNHEKFVSHAIMSVIQQTYENIELIVIDDGSTDNSVQILTELASKHDFKLIPRANKGLSETLNQGITLARGKYVAFCASDDWYHSTKIEKMVSFLECNKQYAMCYSNLYEFDGKQLKVRKVKYEPDGLLFSKIFTRDITLPGITALFHKYIFSEIGLFDTKLYVEDWDMWLRIAHKYKIGFLSDKLAYYRKHDNNSYLNTEKMEQSTNLILEKWKNHPLYSSAKIEASLRFFKTSASHNKASAFGKLLYLLPHFYRKTFLLGLARLILPKTLVKLLKPLL